MKSFKLYNGYNYPGLGYSDVTVKTPTSTSTGLTDTTLSGDQIFDLLSSKRRRNLALIFGQYERDEYDVSALAKELAKFEADDNSQNRCYVALIQQHLPRLEDAGVINYNEPEKTIELRDDVSALSELCELVYGGRTPLDVGPENGDLAS